MQYCTSCLAHCVIFKDKSNSEIYNILSSIDYKIETFNSGDLIFGVSQKTEYMGIILDGCVEVQKHLASGKVVSILYKERGELFGEGSIFSKTITYPCNIFAKKKTSVLLLNKNNMLNLLQNDAYLLSNFITSFANRLLALNLKTELLSYSCIQQKIAFSLLYLLDNYKKNNLITLPFSKKTWSEHLNVSRPSLFRELKNLSDKGILSISDRSIEILNICEIENLLL